MKKREWIVFLFIMIGCIFLDQISKRWIVSHFALAETMQVIKNFFRITYVQNTGAAWSFLTGGRILFISLTVFVLGGLGYYLLRQKDLAKKEWIILAILMGGIIGNMIDRIFLGYVIDFLDFNLGGYDFPVFNLADVQIVVAGILLFLFSWKEEKHDR